MPGFIPYVDDSHIYDIHNGMRMYILIYLIYDGRLLISFVRNTKKKTLKNTACVTTVKLSK